MAGTIPTEKASATAKAISIIRQHAELEHQRGTTADARFVIEQSLIEAFIEFLDIDYESEEGQAFIIECGAEGHK